MLRLTLLIALCIAAPGWAAPAADSRGVPHVPKRGFFTEAGLGAFFTAGGAQHVSNVQSYLHLGVGYDIAQVFELGAHFGLATSLGNCFSGPAPAGAACPYADTFTLAFIELTATYLVKVGDRVYLTPKLAVGYTALDPSPIAPRNGRTYTPALNAGAGFGVEYATLQEHFSIGAEVLVRYVLTANVPAIAVYPRIKYTF